MTPSIKRSSPNHNKCEQQAAEDRMMVLIQEALQRCKENHKRKTIPEATGWHGIQSD